MNEADNEQRARSETVNLYGKEKYEGEVFSKYKEKYQEKEWVSQGIMYIFNLLQNIVVPEGTTITIVGPSGSGQTIIVKLLLRFWNKCT
jgi:ABC-type transport system involved in Fe-S cluster assembly fused permease/ATPase subunit